MRRQPVLVRCSCSDYFFRFGYYNYINGVQFGGGNVPILEKPVTEQKPTHYVSLVFANICLNLHRCYKLTGMLSDMSLVREFTVSICNRDEIRDFIENWHYSKSINGVKSDYCFKLIHGNKIIGACIYGKLAMANVWKKYVDDENDILELRRLCCIDDTPKKY